jgi:hypothetical protein
VKVTWTNKSFAKMKKIFAVFQFSLSKTKHQTRYNFTSL